jgi:hypothetical protein
VLIVPSSKKALAQREFSKLADENMALHKEVEGEPVGSWVLGFGLRFREQSSFTPGTLPRLSPLCALLSHPGLRSASNTPTGSPAGTPLKMKVSASLALCPNSGVGRRVALPHPSRPPRHSWHLNVLGWPTRIGSERETLCRDRNVLYRGDLLLDCPLGLTPAWPARN